MIKFTIMKMVRTTFLLLIPFLSHTQESAHQILTKALAYHDPQNSWSSFSATLSFQEKRPGGSDRATTVEIDNARSYVKIDRNSEEIYEIHGEEAAVLKGDRKVERAILLRNYYIYIWGLPMKLLDPSTPTMTMAEKEVVNGVLAKVLRIAYEKDTWYFYFNPDSGQLLQYKFYQDEAETKGELITLDGELEVAGIIIPQKRNWYTLPEMEYLGTDILTQGE